MSARYEPAPSTESLPSPASPPTADDWHNYRPFILDLYQTKQQTARVVVQELRRHDFVATEKMLRDRLKAWNVRKNASKHTRSESTTSEEGPTSAQAIEAAQEQQQGLEDPEEHEKAPSQ